MFPPEGDAGDALDESSKTANTTRRKKAEGKISNIYIYIYEMPDTTSQKKKKTIIGTEKKIRFKVPWRREKAPVHSPKQKRPKKKR